MRQRFATTRTITWLAFASIALAPFSRISAQDGATALSHNYRTIFDNEQMQVVYVHYNPHEELLVHAHSQYPTVYVYLSNSGPVRFVHDEARAFALTRRPVKTGWFRVSPGRIERHKVENLGPIASDFLRVELKHIPLGKIASEFRFSSDVDLTKSSVTTDYASPQMVIRRYVVAAGGTGHIPEARQPALLVAFTPVTLRERGQAEQAMASGTVLWVKSGTALDVLPADGTSAHVLTIRLLP